LVAAGVDVLVSGSYVFKAPDPLKAIQELKEL
jgi:ribulose-phosphate 3-epimerase